MYSYHNVQGGRGGLGPPSLARFHSNSSEPVWCVYVVHIESIFLRNERYHCKQHSIALKYFSKMSWFKNRKAPIFLYEANQYGKVHTRNDKFVLRLKRKRKILRELHFRHMGPGWHPIVEIKNQVISPPTYGWPQACSWIQHNIWSKHYYFVSSQEEWESNNFV